MGRSEGRRAIVIAAALVAALIVHDLSRPTGHGYGAGAALAAIDVYKAHVSPHLRSFVRCRFRPGCSTYGRESIRKHGLLVGGWRTAVRVARCGPWTPDGTIDLP